LFQFLDRIELLNDQCLTATKNNSSSNYGSTNGALDFSKSLHSNGPTTEAKFTKETYTSDEALEHAGDRRMVDTLLHIIIVGTNTVMLNLPKPACSRASSLVYVSLMNFASVVGPLL
jgi:hypothetical protein